MTSHEQRYHLGPVAVSRIGFGAMQLPGRGYSGRRETAARRLRFCGAPQNSTPITSMPPSSMVPMSRMSSSGQRCIHTRRDWRWSARLARDGHALAITDIACVQNPMNLADRHSLPVLEECEARGIAFVPFFPLGSAFARGNPVLRSPQVASIAARLGRTPAQIALAWLLSFRPNILLIPGTSSLSHLEENMAVGDIELDAAAREALASAG